MEWFLATAASPSEVGGAGLLGAGVLLGVQQAVKLFRNGRDPCSDCRHRVESIAEEMKQARVRDSRLEDVYRQCTERTLAKLEKIALTEERIATLLAGDRTGNQ